MNNNKEIKNKSINNAEILSLVLLAKLSPEDRQWILNYIDEFIINELNISREDLPWLNGKKNINDWRNLVVMVRLSVAKILNTYLDIKKKENLN